MLTGGFIVSVIIGAGVIRTIQKLVPNVVLVDRQFTMPKAGTWSAIALSELDVSLSPTGIVVTSLVRLQQKLLPGEDQERRAHGRLKDAASLYARVIVLVQVGNNPCSHLADTNYRVLTDFIAFTTNLKVPVDVHLIANRDANLAKWIVFLMERSNHESSQCWRYVTLHETTWERFFIRQD